MECPTHGAVKAVQTDVGVACPECLKEDSNTMTKYVVGFLFSNDLKRVVLIRKNRPGWQAGKLNGVGGHIEPEDRITVEAMMREFEEETGYQTDYAFWDGVYASLTDNETFKLSCFAARHVGPSPLEESVKSMTDEEVDVYDVDTLHREDTIDNLMWLIYLAKDHLEDGRPNRADVSYINF